MSADRNLLFGILAVQLDFVTQDTLMAGMNAWLLDRARPLGHILCDLGHMPPGRLELLDALVAEHLRQHGDDPKRSLAALSSVEPIKEVLQSVADIDVQGTLPHVGAGPTGTLPHPGSPPAATGVRYRILRPHARGGLGEVYVAEDTELGRHVALKEIQVRYADHGDSRARFVREAEITGGLEHPGIVPVYGLGTYSDGRPFYAMRFIQGDNLQEAIRRFHARETTSPPDFGSLAFRDLLRRFVDVCNAVAYAHSRGVLHRDLKPGNVMLGQFGETLVVDWGLAKATGRAERAERAAGGAGTLQPRSGGGSSATVAGVALGTPAFMSPEQADGRLDQLGPATDVYSLGATLYEMLTGQAPFAGRSVSELLDAVKSGRFPPPRAVRLTVPATLEAVCLKAMALRTSDRYPSATAVAGEVERYLADEPVAAFPEPFVARARRWVRRHARLATGVAATLTVGLAAVGVVAWQREQARAAIAAKEADTAKERDRANAERDKALEQKKRTRAALDTMVSPEMVERLGSQKELTPGQREFLQTALGYYREFAAEAATDEAGQKLLANAQVRIADILAPLGHLTDAVAAVQSARAIYESLAAQFPAQPDYRRAAASNRNNLGRLLEDLGHHREAEAEYRAAIETFKVLAGELPTVAGYRCDLASCHSRLFGFLYKRGDLARAEVECRAALAIQERLVAEFPANPEYRQDLAGSNTHLGMLRSLQADLAGSEVGHKASLAIRAQLAAEFPTRTDFRRDLASSHNNLALLFALQGKPEEAEASHRAALAIQEKLVADFPGVPNYRQWLARQHSNLASFLNRTGNLAGAEAECRTALAIQRSLAADHPMRPEFRQDLADTRIMLAALHARRGHYAKATTEASAALDGRDFSAGELYNVACIFALASAAAQDEAALVDGHAAKAVALLRHAFAKGFRHLDHMQSDSDLAALRRRDDYAALLWDLADGLPVAR